MMTILHCSTSKVAMAGAAVLTTHMAAARAVASMAEPTECVIV